MSANAIATNVTPVAFNQQNISCMAGNLTYTQDTNVVTIDQNGMATAQAPGSTVHRGEHIECGKLGGVLRDVSAADHYAGSAG